MANLLKWFFTDQEEKERVRARKAQQEQVTNLTSVLHGPQSTDEERRRAFSTLEGLGFRQSPSLLPSVGDVDLIKYAKARNAPPELQGLVESGDIDYNQLQSRLQQIATTTPILTVEDANAFLAVNPEAREKYKDGETFLRAQRVATEIGTEQKARLLGLVPEKPEKPSALAERLAAAGALVTNKDGSEKPWSQVDNPRNQVRADILSVDLAKAYGSDSKALAAAHEGILADIQSQMAFPQFEWPAYQKAFIEGKQGDIPDNTWKLMHETLDKKTALPNKDKVMERSVEDVVDQIAAHTGRRRALNVPKGLRTIVLDLINDGINKREARAFRAQEKADGKKMSFTDDDFELIIEQLDD